VEELIFDRDYTVDNYAQSRRHTLYLPKSDAMILYVALCTSEELRMDTMFGSFWILDTTPMTNIEDRPLTIIAVMCTCPNCYHVTGIIECKDFETNWCDSSHYHFGKNIEYTRTAARIINSKNLGIPYAPSIKKVTKPV
jgi:hypothetical protein